jgi:hypothetical protein
MKYDLIIVACSSSKKLIDITQQCIDSARQDGADLNIIVVETFIQVYAYDGCKIVKYRGEFNYNRALNLGLTYSNADVVILANNDIIFYRGWSQIGDLMIANGFESASAYSRDMRGISQCDQVWEGYNIGVLLTGWCLFVARSCIEKIGKLDESVDFWCSDNVYADQIEALKIRHGLFCNIRVDHLTSATLRTLSYRKQRQYSFDNVRKYKEKQNASR